MNEQALHGNLLTPDGWRRGTLRFDTHIVALEGDALAAPDPALPLVLPGFIDLHVHGGGGADVMEGAAAVRTMARLHARHGTTALLATTMTAPPDDLRRALDGVAQAMAEGPGDGARVLGVHLEGPWLNPARLGAQPPASRAATIDEIRDLAVRASLRVVTLAPEVEGHLALIGPLVAQGVRVQVGHSEGRYEDGVAALAAGASGFTHLFNAMTGLHHRAPGIAGAALAHAQHAELIPDLLHVHPGAIHVRAARHSRALRRHRCHRCGRHARRRLPAGRADGAPVRQRRAPGRRHAGRQRADDGPGAAPPGGAGASAGRGVAPRVARAGRLRGRTPAGRLATGWPADIVVLDGALAVQAVHVGGRQVGP